MVATCCVNPKVQAYIDGVLSGDIVVCKYIRQAVERHNADLLNGESRGIWFDYEEAELAISFIELLSHSKGEWAGKKIYLEPWQSFIIWVIFGWKKLNGCRRFNTAFISVARKNGKSTIGAAIGHKLFVADGEPGAEVYTAATKRDQAKIVHEEAKRMVRSSPCLKAVIYVLRDVLSIDATDSKYVPLGADADTMDGLNPSGVIVDEIHAHKDRRVWDVMDTGTGSRRNPLLVGITTAGDAGDHESIYWELKEYSIKVLSGIREDDSWFAAIYTLDSEYTEILNDIDALKAMEDICNCERAKTIPTERYWREVCAAHAIRDSWQHAEHQSNDSVGRSMTKNETACQRLKKDEQDMKESESQNFHQSRSNEEIDCERNGLNYTRKELVQQISNGKAEEESYITDKRDWQSMDLRKINLPKCAKIATADATFAERKNRYAWITATAQEAFGDYSVSNVIRQSAFLEIMKKVYAEHSHTCKVRNCELRQHELIVKHDTDDWTDESTWIKANPNLGVSVKMDDLRRKSTKAKDTPNSQSNFKRKHLNLETETSTPWISTDTGSAWDLCGGGDYYDDHGLTKETIRRFANMPCYVGGDLSSISDLTALTFAFPQTDASVDVIQFVWCPRDNAIGRQRDNRVSYVTWAGMGILNLTEGDSVDYDDIRHVLRTARDIWKWDIKRIAFDPSNARYLQTKIIEEDGFNEPDLVIDHKQTIEHMNNPIRMVEKLILDGKLRHGGNLVLRWCVSNVILYSDTGGRVRFDKKKSREKIDCAQSMVMAVGQALLNIKPISVYDSREMVSI